MPIDWLEYKSDEASGGLNRLCNFFNKELMPLFLDEVTERKLERYKQDIEPELRRLAFVEGWPHKMEDEEEFQDWLDGYLENFCYDRQALKREFLCVIVVQITRLIESFLFQAASYVCGDAKAPPKDLKELHHLYEATGLAVRKLESYKRTVHVLWLINNVYKHGAGPSKEELRKTRPDLFEQDSVDGEVLCIDPTKVSDFFEGSKSFLSEFVSAAQVLRRKQT